MNSIAVSKTEAGTITAIIALNGLRLQALPRSISGDITIILEEGDRTSTIHYHADREELEPVSGLVTMANLQALLTWAKPLANAVAEARAKEEAERKAKEEAEVAAFKVANEKARQETMAAAAVVLGGLLPADMAIVETASNYYGGMLTVQHIDGDGLDAKTVRTKVHYDLSRSASRQWWTYCGTKTVWRRGYMTSQSVPVERTAKTVAKLADAVKAELTRKMAELKASESKNGRLATVQAMLGDGWMAEALDERHFRATSNADRLKIEYRDGSYVITETITRKIDQVERPLLDIRK